MRTAGEVKRELIDLIWKRKLPRQKIAEDSRCSQAQLWSSLKLEATETVLRRLDAYLDAKHLHAHVKGTRILRSIEMLADELFHEFSARSIPLRDFALMDTEKQKWILRKMHYRGKKLLRLRHKEQTGHDLYFSDGASYWLCKRKVESALARQAPHLAQNRNGHRI